MGELSLLISETGAGKEQEYDPLHRISVCFVYKKYLDKDTAFNWYFPIPRTQIVPIMSLSRLGVCSLQCGELLGSWVMLSPFLIFVSLYCVGKVMGVVFELKFRNIWGMLWEAAWCTQESDGSSFSDTEIHFLISLTVISENT